MYWITKKIANRNEEESIFSHFKHRLLLRTIPVKLHMELSLVAKYFVALLYQTESLWADGEQLSSVCGASAVCRTQISGAVKLRLFQSMSRCSHAGRTGLLQPGAILEKQKPQIIPIH